MTQQPICGFLSKLATLTAKISFMRQNCNSRRLIDSIQSKRASDYAALNKVEHSRCGAHHTTAAMAPRPLSDLINDFRLSDSLKGVSQLVTRHSFLCTSYSAVGMHVTMPQISGPTLHEPELQPVSFSDPAPALAVNTPEMLWHCT